MNVLPFYAEKYLNDLQQKERQPTTIKRYHYDLLDFFEWLDKEFKDTSLRTWKSLSPEQLEAYIDILLHERKYNIRTLKRIVTVINQLYLFTIKNGQTNQNPVNQIVIPDLVQTDLTEKDFLLPHETKKLITTVSSTVSLSERQIKAHQYLRERNLSIIICFLRYGLSLKELISLKMEGVHFERNSLVIHSSTNVRTVTVSEEDKKQLYTYYQSIPAPVRPDYHSNDPFFLAFDFQRFTYRWVYEQNQPKALTEIALQKMLRQEVKRAGLRKGISAQHLRNTFIITKLHAGTSPDELMQQLGLKAALSMKRYVAFFNKHKLEHPSNIEVN